MRKLLFLQVFLLIALASIPAIAQTNSYPYRESCPQSIAKFDEWGFPQCSDTSYVAFRLNSTWQGMQMAEPRFTPTYLESQWDSTADWKDAAALAGAYSGKNMIVNKPQPGDVAWFSYGHVAFVESVNSDGTVNVSEYDLRKNGKFGVRGQVDADAYLRLNVHHQECLNEICPGFFQIGPEQLTLIKHDAAGTPVVGDTLPDLRITSAYLTDNRTNFAPGEQIYIYVTVQNAGADIPANARLRCVLAPASQTLPAMTILKDYLKSGSSVTVRIGVRAPTATGSYTLVATINPDNAIAEAESNNNGSTPLGFTVTQIVNLKLSSLSISGGKTKFSAGEDVVIESTTKNEGGALTKDIVVQSYFIDSQYYSWIATDTIPASKLPAGGSFKVQQNFTMPSVGGKYTILACTDDMDVLAEANEDDNCSSVSVTVVEPIPPDPGSYTPYFQDFSNDAHYFTLFDNQGGATLDIDDTAGGDVGGDRSLVVQNRTARSQIWQVEAKKTFFYLYTGNRYVGSIWLKGSKAGKVSISLSREVEPYDGLGLYMMLDVTTSWKQYFFDFAINPESSDPLNPEDIRFSVNLGTYVGKLWIDEISIQDWTPITIPYFENFSDGLSYKLLDQLGSASLTLDSTKGDGGSPCLVASNGKAGDFWKVQVKKTGFTIEPNTTYEGSIYLKTDTAGQQVVLCMSREVEPYDGFGLYSKISATTEWVSYPFTFTTPASVPGPEDVTFQICLGLSTGTLYIDNISISKSANQPSSPPGTLGFKGTISTTGDSLGSETSSAAPRLHTLYVPAWFLPFSGFDHSLKGNSANDDFSEEDAPLYESALTDSGNISGGAVEYTKPSDSTPLPE